VLDIPDTTEVGYCSFPDFLWRESASTTIRKWFGRTEYFRNTDFWERHTEIVAKQTEITLREKLYSPCNSDTYAQEDAAPCYREDIVMNFICIAEERGGKYRLQQNIQG
jgi:hypothetical protein